MPAAEPMCPALAVHPEPRGVDREERPSRSKKAAAEGAVTAAEMSTKGAPALQPRTRDLIAMGASSPATEQRAPQTESRGIRERSRRSPSVMFLPSCDSPPVGPDAWDWGWKPYGPIGATPPLPLGPGRFSWFHRCAGVGSRARWCAPSAGCIAALTLISASSAARWATSRPNPSGRRARRTPCPPPCVRASP